MKRIHLFEIEDFSWCPKFIRETTTDLLLGLYTVLKIYEPAYQKISEVLAKTQETAIIDCCSGSGGPTGFLRQYLDKTPQKDVAITLTDKYPNKSLFKQMEQRFPGSVRGYPESVDATEVPASLKGMRTFFSSFHHFPPDQAVKILQNAVDCGAPIGIFESTQRHPIDFLRAFFSPLIVLFILPFAKRLTWKKFLFTYIIPITPFTYMWDYMVSNLRTYSPKELHDLVAKVNAPGYKWEIGKMMSAKSNTCIPYLIGYKATSK